MRPVQATDDVQLWRLTDVINEKPHSWPIHATPVVDGSGNKFWLVQPAYPVGSLEQRDFVYNRIAQVAAEADGPKWLVRPTLLTEIAFKCRGVSPKYYLKWPGEFEGGKQLEVKEAKPYDAPECSDEDFVRYAALRAGLKDISEFRRTFLIMVYNAVRWLVDERKPLRLGFCTLHVLPYRANWKGILHARWPNIASVFEKPVEQQDGVLDALGVKPALFSADLIEMLDGGEFGWTLEVTPSEALEKELMKTETEMVGKHKRIGVTYVWRWAQMVREKVPEILYVFQKWIKKAARPVASVDDTLPQDQWVLLPKRRRGRVHPVGAPPPATYYRTASHAADGGPVQHTILDTKEIEGVQELLDEDFELGSGLLRKPGGVAARAADDED